MKTFLTALVSFCAFFPFFCDADIVLSKNGKALYTIYASPSAGAIDRFALAELKLHLKKICGDEFSSGISQKTIYLGLSNEAKKLLGRDDLSSKLKDQDSVIQTKNGNLFL